MWLNDVKAAEQQAAPRSQGAATLIRAALLANGFYLHHRGGLATASEAPSIPVDLLMKSASGS